MAISGRKWIATSPLPSSGFPPLGTTKCDGGDPLHVATRFGVLSLPRQVVYHHDRDCHVLPGNAVLPEHHGMLITRSLQEWACLFSLDLSFETAQRLLGWTTQEATILSTTELRCLVRRHGQLLRAAEARELEALEARRAAGTLGDLAPQLVPATPIRRATAWPPALQEAVATALAGEEPEPPEGVSTADWERVLAVRREEPGQDLPALARLGPEVQPDQILVAADGVLVRQPRGHRFWELRTARVTTTTGSRYLSGTGAQFLRQLFLLILLCGGQHRLVTFLVDGAQWLRQFYQEWLAPLPRCECLLDWYHLAKKCRELGSMIARGRRASRGLLAALLRRLWRGDVTGAVEWLEGYRGEAKNEAKLDELLGYLRARTLMLPHYRERRRRRQYIGSGQVEKANDLLVARRQKRKGMHWSEETSDALAALKTLMLNGGWNLYWQERRVLPLAAE